MNARLPRGDLLDDLVAAVGRAVGGDDQLELFRRIVELEQILDAAADDRVLVVSRDDQDDTGSICALATGCGRRRASRPVASG